MVRRPLEKTFTAVTLIAALAAAYPVAASAAGRPSKVQVVPLEVTVAVSGRLGIQASTDCNAHYCAPDGDFESGTGSVGFSSTATWTSVPVVLSGSAPGIPFADGYQSFGDQVTGSWSASGQDYCDPSYGCSPTFTCGGTVAEGTAADTQYLFDKPKPGGDHTFQLSVAGAPTANGPDCDLPGIKGEMMGAYYWNDNTTATGPFSGSVTVTKAELGLPVIVKQISVARENVPPADCTWQGSTWAGGDRCSDTFNWSGTVKIVPSCERIGTGTGYDGLSAEMKSALSSLYSHLREVKGCWHFTIGYRDTSVQQDLYDRWHEIADDSADNPDVCTDLHAAHFKQCPQGYRPDGTAKGGPAVPGSSRHEHGEAADITVTFLPDRTENLAKYRAAAKAAGLCGPPPTDAVHVELPYKKKGEKTASCHFG